jgi:hypothetical protein
MEGQNWFLIQFDKIPRISIVVFFLSLSAKAGLNLPHRQKKLMIFPFQPGGHFVQESKKQNYILLVFLNVYGAPESIPRNEFRQPTYPGGPVR